LWSESLEKRRAWRKAGNNKDPNIMGESMIKGERKRERRGGGSDNTSADLKEFVVRKQIWILMKRMRFISTLPDVS